MSTAVHEELFRFLFTKTDDPEMKARQRLIGQVYVDMTPEIGQELVQKGREEGQHAGRLAEARRALRRVLSRRDLQVSPADEARIDACSDLVTLERWHDQAVLAPSVAEALE